MNALAEKITNWWHGLGESDRRTLFIASPVILVLVLYLLVFQPIISHYLDVKSQRQGLSNSLVWLYENTALVDRMKNQCSRQRLVNRSNDDLLAYAKNIGRRSGTSPELSMSGDRIQLSIDNASGARALAALQTYMCHGFSLSDLQLERKSADSQNVEVSVQLTAASFLRGG